MTQYDDLAAAYRYDQRDSLAYMLYRREINGPYAQESVDFNYQGLLATQALLGRRLTSNDTIVDIGSSSGAMIAQAAITAGVDAQIKCVEPYDQAVVTHGLMQDEELRDRVEHIGGIGEDIPLADDSVDAASGHNVLFRGNPLLMLNEMRRVVRTGGVIAVSSNSITHAPRRHGFETDVAEEVRAATGIDFAIPKPPAEGSYLEDLPQLIEAVGGLRIVPELTVLQESRAIITPGTRFDDYVDSIKHSVANTTLPSWHRHVWREVVDLIVSPQIQAEFAAAESARGSASHEIRRDLIGPYFADPIVRGMFVLQVTK